VETSDKQVSILLSKRELESALKALYRNEPPPPRLLKKLSPLQMLLLVNALNELLQERKQAVVH
jgi:hypothetical protein